MREADLVGREFLIFAFPFPTIRVTKKKGENAYGAPQYIASARSASSQVYGQVLRCGDGNPGNDPFGIGVGEWVARKREIEPDISSEVLWSKILVDSFLAMSSIKSLLQAQRRNLKTWLGLSNPVQEANEASPGPFLATILKWIGTYPKMSSKNSSLVAEIGTPYKGEAGSKASPDRPLIGHS
jgi:hypothetical protein